MYNSNVNNRERIRKLDSDEFFKDAESTDLFKEVEREMQVARWKEIYSREFLVPSLCTAKEYDSIPASTERADMIRYQQDFAYLANQVVGAEI